MIFRRQGAGRPRRQPSRRRIACTPSEPRCEPTAAGFAAAYAQVVALEAAGKLQPMGEAARAHVGQHFSLDAFGRQLETYLLAALGRRAHAD